MTTKNIVNVTITPLEETHPLVMIFWTETTFNKDTKKVFYHDKFFIKKFKLSKFIAEKTNASLKKFEKNISGLYCDKCNVWESYLRADELKAIMNDSYDYNGKFSTLIANVCSNDPITDTDDQNIICIDFRRSNVNGHESVYLQNGKIMKFGKSADRAAYSEYRYHVVNGLKKYYSQSFKNIHPNNMRYLVDEIKKITSDKKTLDDIDNYYKIIEDYKYLDVSKVRSIEDLREKVNDVMYAQKFIQSTYNYITHKHTAEINHNRMVELQRKELACNANYDRNFPTL